MDTYNNFKSLSKVEKKCVDYKIDGNKLNSQIAIIAPHGGGIEPGTSEIAKAIAGDNFSYYSFDGIKPKENKKYLHITSINFDEPKCVEICKNSNIVVTVHGAEENCNIVYVGGLNEDLKYSIIRKLECDPFNAQEDKTKHSGQDKRNICNKGINKAGLQLEISKGLRRKMFKGLKCNGRKCTTKVFDKFVKLIRLVLCEYNVEKNHEKI